MAAYFNDFKLPDVLLSTIKRYLDLKQDGREYKACCPFHHETTPSFTVVPEKGFYHCFGCRAHGDAIDFVMEYDEVDFNTAKCIVTGEKESIGNTRALSKQRLAPPDPYEGIISITPPDEPIIPGQLTPKLWNPKRNKYTNYTPSAVYPYFDFENNLIGYVLRVDFGDNVKITPTIQYAKLPDSSECWCHLSFDEPRTLYGAHRLIDNNKPVLIVEGEKSADAAHELLGDQYVCVTWAGGSNAFNKSSFEILTGRKVLLWPDMDEAGMQAMLGNKHGDTWRKGVGGLLQDIGAESVRYISLDETKPKGWDVADALAEGWGRDTVIAWGKKFVRPFTQLEHVTLVPDEHNPLHDVPPLDVYDGYFDHDNVLSLPVENARTGHEEGAWWQLLKMKDNAPLKPVPSSLHNGIIFLQYHDDMDGVLAYNELAHSIDVVAKAPWDDNRSKVPRKIQDQDVTQSRSWLELQGITLSTTDTHAAMCVVAHKRRYNPLQMYIEGLCWDRTPRLDFWLIRYFGVPDTEYTRIISRKFLIGAIARAMKPGCKMDNMLILEGAQGGMKSTAVEVLFGTEWFTDEVSDIGSKDAAMQLQSRWGIEIAELNAMNKADHNHMKAFTSRTVDKFRLPYGRTVIESPRSCVFIGTVNPEGGYLKDSTGGRRYWPVRCDVVDIDSLRFDRDQLWAEAKHAYEKHEQWWLNNEDVLLAQDEQEDRYEGDSWTDHINEYLIGKSKVTVPMILEACLELPKAQWNRSAEMRVGKHLKKAGWIRKQVREESVRMYVYERSRTKEQQGNVR